MRILHVHTTHRRSTDAKRDFEKLHEDEVFKSYNTETLMLDGTLHRWATISNEFRGTEWNSCVIDELVSNEDRQRIAPLVGRRK